MASAYAVLPQTVAPITPPRLAFRFFPEQEIRVILDNIIAKYMIIFSYKLHSNFGD